MSDSVSMPALGESVTEGTVTRWLKQVGDRVEVDEPLLEVSTDKVDTEIPSPFAGTLQEILVAEDETVEVGAALATIGDGAPSAAPGSDSGSGADAGSEPEPPGESGSGDESLAEPETEPEPQTEPERSEPQQAEPEEASQPAASSPSSDGSDSRDGSSGASADSGSGDGTPITMPALGESVTEGTVTRWLKQEGDTVAVDEPLLEVSTDKVDTEIPSPVAGTISRILVGEDETVEVGAQLAIVGGSSSDSTSSSSSGSSSPPDAEERPEPEPEKQPEPEPRPQAQPEPEPEPQPQPEPRPERQPEPEPAPAASEEGPPPSPDDGRDAAGYVTPLVRRMAGEHGVDLGTITGTGVGGRIRKQDVIDAARAREAAARPADQPTQPSAQPGGDPAADRRRAGQPVEVSAKRGTSEKMTRLRKVIAERMVASLQTSAQLTTVVEVDVTRIAQLRARAKADFETREGVRLSFLPFLALACVEALKQHPKLNASIEGDQIVYHPQENLGVAVDTERGLLVPTIREAGDLNIAGLARKIADLAARTRNNKVSPDELGGGTFTLTNTGSRGALFDTPIIFQPQVAILGTGAVVKRPVVITDEYGAESIAIRSVMYLALSYDHRLVDGADAARFLVTIRERLEEGAFEADLGL